MLCPFGRPGTDCSKKKLSEEDKQWVMNEIIDRRESPATIARAHNLNCFLLGL